MRALIFGHHSYRAIGTFVFFALILCQAGAALGAITFHQSATRVDAWDYIEVTALITRPAAANPFTQVEFTGEVQSGTAALVKVDGFCDSTDGSLFRIRFMPVRPGPHSYNVTLRQGDFTETHTGTFTARPGKHPGLVQVDREHPSHFVYAHTGQHFFWNSTTTYWLLGWQDDAIIRESLERLAKLKVNRIRVALNARTTDGLRWGEPDVKPSSAFQFRVEPWPAARPPDIANPGYDTTRFNLELWRKCEWMLACARRLGIQVSLIFYLDGEDIGVDPFGKAAMGGADERRYYRYAAARLAAFDNVMWDVTNEWHLFRDEAWVNATGEFLKRCDPYGHLMSVHGHGDFPFSKSAWPDFAQFQSWDEHGAYGFITETRRQQAATGRVIPQINEEYGYEDHYPFPWGEKRLWPARIGETRGRIAWEITMAGGYQTTGERANVPGCGGWITGRGNDQMTMLAGYARMRNFFEQFAWWKLEPRADLVSTNAYCLVEPGNRCVVYLRDGGAATAQLEPGRWSVQRFDPRTARYEKLPGSAGGNWTSPVQPKNENWVFLLERN